MLHDLTIKKNIRTFSVCPENLTGEKGKGGMATEGTGSDASRELGQGWKVNPYLKALPGETIVLADIKGRGHYVGTYMHWGVKSNGGWGEGEIKFYIDGDAQFPSICGRHRGLLLRRV